MGITGRIDPTTRNMTPNPTFIPNRCGKDRLTPNRIPEAMSIELFGPGVMDVINANTIKLTML